MTDETKEIAINVPVLARVEGEGALELHIKDDSIETLHLKIFEPPRLFEKLLVDREHQDVIDMVARICGICPVAYQMSAVNAIENAFNINVMQTITDMRRMMMCGEWIESHALHIHLLAAPDFLGFANAIDMAKQYPEEVRRGLRIQAAGNHLIKLFGGRSVHPVGVCAGGFHHHPTSDELSVINDELSRVYEDAEALVRWVAALDLPDDRQEFISISLRHPDHYPMNQGRIVGSDGLDIAVHDYEDCFAECQVEHSTAKYAHYYLQNTDRQNSGQPYLVGPLARLNNNSQQLHQTQLDLLQEIGVSFPDTNMFHSIIARAIEIHYALEEALQLINRLSSPSENAPVTPVAATGTGASEAPRGILWHKYEFDTAGRVVKANIVPPTSQNQARIEQDLHTSLTRYGLANKDEDLRLQAEKVIRNYDPCISCATHFLQLKAVRE